MASISKCPFCGADVASDQRKCPACGGVNENYVEHNNYYPEPPRTIEELKEYCAKHRMPLEKMRFFCGQDFRDARAFGIYRDGGSFIVYQNKSDGTRAVRYSGPDEAYAVREIFTKLLDECHARGIVPENQ